MRNARLPDGFGVRLDPQVRAYSGGRVLIGGSPMRMLKLAPAAAEMIGDGYLEVVDSQTAVVARRLLDSGVGNPRPMSTPSPSDVTVVVPIRDNVDGIARLVPALRGLNVIVVDDGSATPLELPDLSGCTAHVTLLRHDASRGPAAARNTGLRAAQTPFVAFLDSDVVPKTGWLELMLGHFSDPAVALVAPRIVALEPEGSMLARYEHTRSSLDLGRKEAAVRSGSPVAYVPSAAMLVRRDVLVEAGGFDETMHVAEDVDLCWRLQESGWRLRYEPVSQVAHDHRVTFRKWFSRKLFYGTGAAPLASRHDGMVPPLAMSKWTLFAVLAAATGTRIGLLGSLATLLVTATRLRRTFRELDQPTRIAAILAARGFAGGAWQLASAMCRHYWPVTFLAVLCSPRIRRLAVAVAVAEGVVDWVKHREPGGLDPLRHTAFKRLDDVAYGAGLWQGAIRARDLRALAPRIGS
ncbi:mycofactocin biosynthesis glycosyltransferase MftF [Prescottella equi]|uniref:Mycofactocin system glycosyltransferase n=1 Tax=Rhodococcus hoagii TaxID=43767 RepID=A0AAE5MHP0_RHOHA|nr:mycofactocin biosynthesis glycosyltransferase MftF [Prescottella equi]MBM4628925.1 mycofactocin system glycosyltransferase [Prescottella equi]ORL26365.1 mycofactocin system glycosyltransferase [Prescottella equi]ORL96372.1 mycofactocin system glycosyltransferase [Prescottella equi]ORM23623.1 mycofactocin system glycosyltransferase [Prescottella equi]QPQ77633.1 mycofactocin biosynthesis glycosyltransferase MftF [Prescottella equi]